VKIDLDLDPSLEDFCSYLLANGFWLADARLSESFRSRSVTLKDKRISLRFAAGRDDWWGELAIGRYPADSDWYGLPVVAHLILDEEPSLESHLGISDQVTFLQHNLDEIYAAVSKGRRDETAADLARLEASRRELMNDRLFGGSSAGS